MVELPNSINNIDKYIIEVGILSENNIFNTCYLLIYNNEKDFEENIKYIQNLLGFEVFLESLQFNNDNNLKLFDEENNVIGEIIKLTENENKQNVTNNNNIESNIICENKKNAIKDNFITPPLIGLENLSFTSYLNATLQCLCQIEKLVNYFKYNNRLNEIIKQYKDNNNNETLIYAFKNIIENLWPSNPEYINNEYNHQNMNNKYFSPYKFKEIFIKMYNNNNKEPKDLINFFIAKLHDELNKAPKNTILNNSMQIEPTNKMVMLNNFAQKFIKENQSILSDLFYGIKYNCLECSNCKIMKYYFNSYLLLIFPLDEIKNYKIKQLQNNFMLLNQNFMLINPILYQQNLLNFQLNLQNINSVNMLDCFEYEQNKECFIFNNSQYCNNCNNIFPFHNKNILYTIPEILIIALKREIGSNIKLEFIEELNLMNFIEMKDTGFQLKLIGVISYIGNENYISYCKSPIDLQWYKYEDDSVSKVINFNEQIINYGVPYILFYQKIK